MGERRGMGRGGDGRMGTLLTLLSFSFSSSSYCVTIADCFLINRIPEACYRLAMTYLVPKNTKGVDLTW